MKLFVNEHQLIIPPDTKFRFKMFNPAFSLNGTYSFPFTLPAAENRVALGFPERYNIAADREFVYDVSIRSKALPFSSGRLFVSPTANTLECSLVCGEGEFFNSVQNKKLSEMIDVSVDMGSDEDEFIENANELVNSVWPEAKVQFPLMHITEPYENEVINKFFKFINYYKWHEETPGYAKNNYLNPGLSDAPDAASGTPCLINPYNLTTYLPCPFVFEVLKNLVGETGFLCENTPVFSDSQINQLLYIPNKTIDTPPSVVTNEVVKLGLSANQIIPDSANPKVIFDLTSGAGYQDIYNKYDTDLGWFNGYYGDGKDRIFQFHYKLLLYNHTEGSVTLYPRCVSLHSNISIGEETTIESYHFQTIEGNLLTYYKGSMDEIEAYCEFMLNFEFNAGTAITVLAGSTLDIVPISDTLTIKPQTVFNLGNYVPDITAAELLHDLKWLFGIVPFARGNSIEFKFFRDIAQGIAVADLSQYMLENYKKGALTPVRSLSFPNGFDSSDFAYTSPTPNVLPYSTEVNQVIYMRAEGHFYRNDHDQYYNFSWQRWRNDVNRRQILPESFVAAEGSAEDIVINGSIPELIMSNHDYTSGTNWLALPSLDFKLISPFNKADTEASVECVYAFWRGMQNDGSGAAYPFCTPFAYKLGGSVVSGVNTQLRFNGTYGLYAKYLTELVAAHNTPNSLRELELNLPTAVLRSLAFDKKYLFEGVEAIIYSIDVEIDAIDEIKQPVSLEVVKIY